MNFSLQRIDLLENVIGDEGAREIAELNSSMVDICLRGNRIRSEKIIEQALEGCRNR